jgi:hypothetical protein
MPAGIGGAAGSEPGGHAVKMNQTGMWIGVTVLALGVGLLAMPTLQGRTAAGISRVGWALGIIIPPALLAVADEVIQ